MMNREILFRGKHNNSGEWKYGDLLRAEFSGESLCWIVARGGENKSYAVEPSTVGQYTELKDHTGKRIFDGDIVANYDPDEGRTESVGVPVVWHDAGFCIEYPTLYHILEREDWEYLAVIGNVYDNPELLIGGAQ